MAVSKAGLAASIVRVETELLQWVDGRRSTTNEIQSIEPDRPTALVRVEQADAATIERLTASLRALYLIRDGRI